MGILNSRESWDDFFFSIAKVISNRSTCLHRQYGCVLVKDKTIVSTGFNAAPRGCKHCSELGCAREGLESGERPELCRGTHAEQNAVANAARMGICVKNSELYLYPGDLPCPLCAKILINAGVSLVHYTSFDYPGWRISLDLFKQANVLIVQTTEESW